MSRRSHARKPTQSPNANQLNCSITTIYGYQSICVDDRSELDCYSCYGERFVSFKRDQAQEKAPVVSILMNDLATVLWQLCLVYLWNI